MSGYNQVAPGRDLSSTTEPKPNGRPRNQNVINQAILGGLPVGQATFRGAQTSVGAPPLNAPANTPTQFGPNNTGVAGNQGEINAARSTLDNLGTSLGGYGLEGFDSAKLNSNHDSAKYQIGRTISHFDPSQGISPELLQALNALGIGNFSGSGDKLHIENGSHGLEGPTDIDLIRDFGKGGANAWQYGLEGGAPSPVSGMSNPMASAILGAVPTAASGDDYATRIRQQVMQALLNQPGLAGLAGQYLK